MDYRQNRDLIDNLIKYLRIIEQDNENVKIGAIDL